MKLLLALILLGIALAPLPLRADYDPEAGIQRLIDQSRSQRKEIQEALTKLRSAREQMKREFLLINQTGLELSGHLRRIRMIDARNKAMLVISTGLNITAVNAPETLAEVGTSIATDLASEYLRNNHPGLFDTSVSVVLPKLGLDSVQAVRKFNEALALDDPGIERRIFAEDPGFAEQVANRGWLQKTLAGNKLSDELVALKRAQFLLRDGTAAEQALEQLKAALLAKQQQILGTIELLERYEKGAEEGIRSWERNLEVTRTLVQVSKAPPTTPVTWVSNASYDFSSAAEKMRGALVALKDNKIDCNGYDTNVGNAHSGAARYRSERINDACRHVSWDSPGCASTRATVGQAYESQVNGTLTSLAEDFRATREGPVAGFLKRLDVWQHTPLSIPNDYWDKTWLEVEGGRYAGNDLATSIYAYSLNFSPVVAENWFVPESFGLNLEGLRSYTYTNLFYAQSQLEQAQSWSRETRLQADKAASSDRIGRQLASDAGDLAKTLEPHRHYWGCVAGRELNHDWIHLRRFAATYPPVADDGARRVVSILDWIQKEQSNATRVVSLLAAERGILELVGGGEEQARRLGEAARAAGGSLNYGLDPYPLWSLLKRYGIQDQAIKEIEAALPKLKDIDFAIAFALEQGGSQPGYNPNPKTIHDADMLAQIKERLSKTGAARIANQGEYRDLYHETKRIQERIASRVGSLRSGLAAVIGHDAGPGTPVVFHPDGYVVPNDLPDPTLGVFEQFERYAKVAAQYHAIIGPMQPWTFPLYGDLKKLHEQVETEGDGRAARTAGFSEWHATQMNELLRLQKVASMNGHRRIDPAAPFGKLARDVMNRLHDLASRVTLRERVMHVSETLVQLLKGGEAYLAHPETQGGAAVAGDWLRYLAEPLQGGSEASSLRGSGNIAGLLDQISGLRQRIDAWRARGGETAVHKLYAEFAAAYQARDVGRLTRLMARDWKAGDGSDRNDLEDILGNSFRVFDRIRFLIQGMQIRALGDDRYSVSYGVTLSGEIQQSGLKHQESSQVEDIVSVGPEGARISSTRGGQLWLR
ncbi:MAG: hypothetical protein Q8Q28_04185 [Pseudomonadota bacterium]|nr:hypothetical protein [Pseudomonadota bacterium]